MLGGVAPLIIFTIQPDDPNAAKDALSGLPPILAQSLETAFGIPIPIYLDENLTGILLDGDDRNLNFETALIQSAIGKSKSKYTQRGVQSDVTINLRAKADSLILTAIVALIEQCFELAVARKYSISYFNGATVLIGGLLTGFNSSQDPNANEITIQITLTKKHGGDSGAGFPSLPAVQGPTPL